MLDIIFGSVQGFVKILDKATGEILVDTHNDVLYGNISSILAHTLNGNSNSLLSYMAFGNGGAIVDPTGIIRYKPTYGGAASLIKQPSANLYNTVYVKKLSNDSTPTASYTPTSRAYISSSNQATNYEDITVDVTLAYNELPTAIISGSSIQQAPIDTSTLIGSPNASNSTFDPNNLVFNEIGLFAGTGNLFTGNYSQNVADITSFNSQQVSFSTAPDTKSKLMITHVVFHPIQKAANRELQIIYTLRIQMGAR